MAKAKEPVKADVLGAYPLRLNVAALPDRRFFRMTHTLTIVNCLLLCFLIGVACFFYYAMDNQDISITYGPRNNALYRLDPESKSLRQVEHSAAIVSPVQLLVEEKLRQYLINRNKVSWDLEYMATLYKADELLAQMSRPPVFTELVSAQNKTIQSLRSRGLIRDIHLYELKLVRDNLWMAIFDLFDIPLNNNLESFCPCQDNSKSCLFCKRSEAKSTVRYKVWIRTNLQGKKTKENPLGILVANYTAQIIPIHDDEGVWGLPPILRPDI